MTWAVWSMAVLLSALQAKPPELTLAGGPERAFGGQTLRRACRVEGEGQYELAWQTRIFRGIVERGKQEVAAPAEVSIELNLPAVRARVEMIQEVELRRDGKVVASASFPLALFPRDILSELGGPQSSLSPVGLYDPSSVVTPVFERAGVKFERIQTNLQVRGLESRTVIVAPDQANTLAEPMGGIRELAESGGTAIFLEQAEPQKVLFTEDMPTAFRSCNSISAVRLTKKEHPLFRDILEGDLSNWAGAKRVASRCLAWPEWTDYCAWLASDEAGGNRPLLMECWPSRGRVISCQLEVGAQLAEEPVAQLLLRNLVQYARSNPPPVRAQALRMAIPRQAVAGGRFDTKQLISDPKEKDLVGAIGILVLIRAAPAQPPAPGFNLAKFLASDGHVVIQSAFEDDMLAAVNDLVRSAWGEDLRSRPPTFKTADVPEEVVRKVEVDYSDPLTWGISSQTVERALDGAEEARRIEVEQDTPGFGALTRPVFLAKFKRGQSRLLLCSLPMPDEDHPERARVMGQLVTNASLIEEDRMKKPLPE